MYVRKSIGFAAAVAMLAGAGTAAEAQSKIQWRHAMGGALGEKVVEIAVGFNASQSEYVSEWLMADSGVDFDPANYLSQVTGYYTDPDGNMLSMPFNSSTPVLYYVLARPGLGAAELHHRRRDPVGSSSAQGVAVALSPYASS